MAGTVQSQDVQSPTDDGFSFSYDQASGSGLLELVRAWQGS